ncbi:hypothetical protein MNBD_GAMMA05-1757 [hydrothermal vent metagenome]|uniref:Uncharacterized protein n=1 Tax=hydrothermal vent metagenome TaxID=652676 RepID=A0A3B0X6E3_9ZZZZ
MKKELSATNFLLLFFTVYFSAVLIGLGSHYWSVVDYIALPLANENLFLSGSSDLVSFMFLSLIDQVKGMLLDLLIMVGGYDLLITFRYIVLAILCISVVKYLFSPGKVVILSISICVLSLILSVQIIPDISKQDVDNAFFSYPANRKITTDFRELLRKRDFSKLDAFMEKHVVDYKNGLINVNAYELGFTRFLDSAAQEVEALNEWVERSKVPEIALIVRAGMYENLGWKKRGIAFAKETSDEQFTGMKKYFDLAIVDLNRAMEIDDEILYAYMVLMRVADIRMEKADAAAIFNKGREKFPDNYAYAYYHLKKLVPKWGGSLSKMRALANTYKNEYINNPLLLALKGLPLIVVADSEYGSENYQKSVNLYKRALLYGLRRGVMNNTYYAYKKMKEYDKAAEIMTLCLDGYSGIAECYFNRATAYTLGNEWDKVKADLKSIESMDLEYSWKYQNVGWMYETIKENKQAVKYYMRASDMDNSNTYTLERLYTLSYYKYVSYEDVLPYMKRWAEINPKNAEPWLKYADTLEDIDPVKSIPLYEKYLSLIDYEDEKNKELINKVKQQIEELSIKGVSK